MTRPTHDFITRIEWEPQRGEGAFDEIVTGPVDSVHIERMGTGQYWMALYQGDKRQVIWFELEKRTIVGTTRAE